MSKERQKFSKGLQQMTAFVFKKRIFWEIVIFLIPIVISISLKDKFKDAWSSQGKPISDARALDITAINILKGRGISNIHDFFHVYSFRPPLYPVFLSFIYSIFGHNYDVARIIQIILFSLTCVFVFRISEMTFKSRTGAFVSAALVGSYTGYIYYAFAFMTENLYLFFFVLCFYQVLRAEKTRSIWNAIFAGLFLGLGALTRTTILGLLPVYILWFAFVFRKRPKVFFKMASVTSVTMFLTISPWVVRNYLIHGQFLFESGGVRQMWTCVNPAFGGASYSREAWREALWAHPYATEGERTRRLSKEIVSFIRDDFIRFLEYSEHRLPAFFLFGERHTSLENMKFKLSYLNTFLSRSMLLLCVIGFFLLFRRERAVPLYVGVVVIYSIIHSMAGSTPRYRFPLDWIFIAFSSYVIYMIATIKRVDWRAAISRSPDEYERMPYYFRDAPLRRWKRVLLSVLIGLFGISVLFYTSKLVYIYQWKGEKPFEGYKNLPVAVIEEELHEADLIELWKEQGKRLLSEKDVFDEIVIAKKSGLHFPRHIIAWTGEASYITRNYKGYVSGFILTVNAHGRYPGDANLWCEVLRPQDALKEIHENQIVTIVGHIRKGAGLGAPATTVIDIIPYRED